MRIEKEPIRKVDPVQFRNGDWGFWDETWSIWAGGYRDETAARNACKRYAKSL